MLSWGEPSALPGQERGDASGRAVGTRICLILSAFWRQMVRRHTEIGLLSAPRNCIDYSSVSNPRVKYRNEQIQGEGCDADRDDHNEDDAVDHEIIKGTDGLIEEIPNARVGEDDLHQDRPGHDPSHGQGERGKLGKNRVANGVTQEDAPCL